MTTLISTASFTDPQELEQVVLEQFAPMFYNTKHPNEASARFRLTRAVLHDIWADCGINASPHECHERLFNAENQVHDLFTEKWLIPYAAVAGHGQMYFAEHDEDPTSFAPEQTIPFVSNLLLHVNQMRLAA